MLPQPVICTQILQNAHLINMQMTLRITNEKQFEFDYCERSLPIAP